MANVTELDVIDNILDDTGIFNVIPRAAGITATYHRMMHTFTDVTTSSTTDERNDRLYTSFLASMDDDEDDDQDDSSNDEDSIAVRGIMV